MGDLNKREFGDEFSCEVHGDGEFAGPFRQPSEIGWHPTSGFGYEPGYSPEFGLDPRIATTPKVGPVGRGVKAVGDWFHHIAATYFHKS
jgi:hypothetical protein